MQGLQYVKRRAAHSREQMTQAGLALRLEAAQALLALGRLDEAADAFALLKKWTSEGDITFPYVAGIMPVSVRQEAARGLARVRPRLAYIASLRTYGIIAYTQHQCIHTA